MREQDVDAVAQLARRLSPDPWPRQAFEHELRRPFSYTWVAVVPAGEPQGQPPGTAERVVGYVVLWVQGEMGEIADIGVDPAYQGRGIGTALMQQALNTARGLGLKGMGLEVRVNNHRAQAWYRRLGFRPVRRLRGYYRVAPGRWEDGLRMELWWHPPEEA